MARYINRFSGVLAGVLLGGLTSACSAPEDELELLVPSAPVSASVSVSSSGSGSTSATASTPGTSSAVVTTASASALATSPSASLTSSASALPTSTASASAVVPSASVTFEIPDAATADDAGDAGVSPSADASGDAGVSPTSSATAVPTAADDGGVPTDDAGPVEDATLAADAADESDAGNEPAVDSSVTEPDASVPVWTANVACDWGTSATATTQRVEPVLTLTNLDSATLNLSAVEIRYYFSADGHEATVDSDIYYTTASTRTHIIEASPGLGSDADHYLSVKFVGCNGAGCTLADGNSATVQAAIIVNNGGATFNALNDYSYGVGLEDPCDSVVVLKSGAVIFGNLPE
jgi:Cellulose binding domain